MRRRRERGEGRPGGPREGIWRRITNASASIRGTVCRKGGAQSLSAFARAWYKTGGAATLFVFPLLFWQEWRGLGPPNPPDFFFAAMPRIEVYILKSTWETRLPSVISPLLQSFLAHLFSACFFALHGARERVGEKVGEGGLAFMRGESIQKTCFLCVWSCFGCLTSQESRSTRLGTRTKEPNPCASGMVIGKP